jgi:Domain of unknown function (DUF4920)
MLKNFIVLLGLTAMFQSCTNAQVPANAQAGQKFGAPITAEGAIAYDDLVTKMATVDSLGAKVKGKVSGVCQKKGCWMTLVPEQPGKPEMRVSFKDYAFFMPKDLSGHTVIIDGFALVETTPIEDLRHYAQDAGKSKEEIEKITEPKRELNFEAAGVIVVD